MTLPPIDPSACALSLTALAATDVCPRCACVAVQHRGWQRELERGAIAHPGTLPIAEPDPAPPIVEPDPAPSIVTRRYDDGDPYPVARTFFCGRCGQATGFDPRGPASDAHCIACDGPRPPPPPRQSFPVKRPAAPAPRSPYLMNTTWLKDPPPFLREYPGQWAPDAPPPKQTPASARPAPRPTAEPSPDPRALDGRLGWPGKGHTKSASTRGMLADFIRLLARAVKR